MSNQEQQVPEHLRTTREIDPAAAQNVRTQAMFSTMEEQRNILANEVVNVRADLALMTSKLALEIQTSRQFQANIAVVQQQLELANTKLAELHTAFDLQAGMLDEANGRLNGTIVDNAGSVLEEGQIAALSTSSIPALEGNTVVLTPGAHEMIAAEMAAQADEGISRADIESGIAQRN